MVQNKSVNTEVKEKVLSQEHLKMTHSFETQLRPLRQMLFGLHLDLFRDVSAAQSFADFVCHGVLHQGNGFLKVHRTLVIQGLRVLGLEKPTFSEELPLKGGYPSHYGLIFRELETHGNNLLVSSIVSDDYGAFHDYVRVNHDYSKKYRGRVQALLTLLNWPKYVRLGITKEKKSEILSAFREKITDILDPSVSFRSVSDLSSRLAEGLFSRPELKGISFPDRISLDLSKRTYKGRRDVVGKIPAVLIDMIGANRFYSDEGVQGSSTVLSEAGGKSRIIVGYNGLLNSTDFYDRVRLVLDRLKNDCSSNQNVGHLYVKRGTRRSGWLVGHAPKLVCADLDAFTDNLSMLSVNPYLKRLNSSDFQTIASSPISIDGEEVYPVKFLMGLKGTFEIASVVHHGIISSITDDYVICGDDIAFETTNDSEESENYFQLCQKVGLKINFNKTIQSPTVGVFCGEAYWDGEEISPLRIPIYTIRENLKDRRSLSRAAGSIISRSYSLPRSFRKVFISSIVRILSASAAFRGRQIPKYLPAKLGGLGINCSRGLLKLLDSYTLRSYVQFNNDVEPVRETISRFYVPFRSPSDVPRFPWCRNLLIEGGYVKPRISKSSNPNWDLKDIVSILIYFYDLKVA